MAPSASCMSLCARLSAGRDWCLIMSVRCLPRSSAKLHLPAVQQSSAHCAPPLLGVVHHLHDPAVPLAAAPGHQGNSAHWQHSCNCDLAASTCCGACGTLNRPESFQRLATRRAFSSAHLEPRLASLTVARVRGAGARAGGRARAGRG
jgi:hypothetical protein